MIKLLEMNNDTQAIIVGSIMIVAIALPLYDYLSAKMNSALSA